MDLIAPELLAGAVFGGIEAAGGIVGDRNLFAVDDDQSDALGVGLTGT